MRFRSRIFALLLSIGVVFTTGCGDISNSSPDPDNACSYVAESNPIAKSKSSSSSEAKLDTATTTTKKSESSSVKDLSGLANLNFDGTNAFIAVNDNEPQFTEEDKSRGVFEEYSDLDSLGRCGVAFANICTDIMPTEERGAIGMVKPSGWHTVKYDCVDGKYLYNRCHLIGFQLAGENANEKNLITGTRYLNIEGMLLFENMVTDYVKETGNHVLYRVTPVYSGDGLVARGVQMEGYSLEDNGEGISYNVYCFNAQPGVNIDYATGDSWLSGESKPKTTTEVTKESTSKADTGTSSASSSSEKVSSTYVINTNTGKFHSPDCSSVNRMSEQNKKEFNGTRDELISQGYEPCGICNP